jgi:Cu/Ag efflux protein CusF
MKRLNFFFVFLLVVIASFRLKAAPDVGQTSAKSYDVRGVVRQIADDRRKVTIQHAAIADYMSAMIMEFTVKDTNELNGISPSDEITFKLFVGENDSWIEDIHFVAHSSLFGLSRKSGGLHFLFFPLSAAGLLRANEQKLFRDAEIASDDDQRAGQLAIALHFFRSRI